MSKSTLSSVFLVIILINWAAPVLADGCYIPPHGFASDLAQTRQEAILAIYDDEVTYVLSTRYAGDASELAWVLPIPATPTDVIAHEDDSLFDLLADQTSPRFTIWWEDDYSFGCASYMGDAGGNDSGLVEVEASGQAGIYDWAALTSTGSTALLDWLNDNDFAVPASAEDILDDYIEQDMHFLAVRVSEPDEVTGDGDIELPPIQFTCQTTRRFYPMVISQISAADETEVLIYVVAGHRAKSANIPNAEIDEELLTYDPGSESLTNYESLFRDTIEDLGGMALITESVGYATFYTFRDVWPDIPTGLLRALFDDDMYLTRMRTVIARNRMEEDFEFTDADDDTLLHTWIYVDASTESNMTTVAGSSLGMLLLFALFLFAPRRLRQWRR